MIVPALFSGEQGPMTVGGEAGFPGRSTRRVSEALTRLAHGVHALTAQCGTTTSPSPRLTGHRRSGRSRGCEYVLSLVLYVYWPTESVSRFVHHPEVVVNFLSRLGGLERVQSVSNEIRCGAPRKSKRVYALWYMGVRYFWYVGTGPALRCMSWEHPPELRLTALCEGATMHIFNIPNSVQHIPTQRSLSHSGLEPRMETLQVMLLLRRFSPTEGSCCSQVHCGATSWRLRTAVCIAFLMTRSSHLE